MKRPLKFPLKYEKGIRLITRKDTTKEAEKAFTVFYLFKIRELQIAKYGRSDEALVQKLAKENVEYLRGLGQGAFDEAFFNCCKYDYAQMPRRAPRKRVKKEFDAKGLPKMPKTPENRALMREFIRIRQQNLEQKSASSELKLPKTG